MSKPRKSDADRLVSAVFGSNATAKRPITTPSGSWLVQTNDLSRMYLLDVSADGACFVRRRGEPMAHKGLLPVFSCDDEEDARSLIVLHCKLARDRSGIYRLNPSLFDPNADESVRVDQLSTVADAFREAYGRTIERRRSAR